MKNLNLLRLAGFGFFGAVFLSPAVPGQDEDWLLEKLNVAKKLTCLPFTMSALYRENYLTEPKTIMLATGSTTKPNFFLSVFIPEDPPADTVVLLQPVYAPRATNTVSLMRMPVVPATAKTKVESVHENNQQTGTDEQTQVASLSKPTAIISDKENPEPNEEIEPVDRITYMNNAHLPEYIPGEQIAAEEELFPPAEYVDEVIVPRQNHLEKVSSSSVVPIITTQPETGLDVYPIERMGARIHELFEYATENDYSTEYAFMINLGLKSGKKRFFLVDLRTGAIVNSGLVAHGRGKEKFTLNKSYSNAFGSSCSSLGLYKVGSAYSGGFGKSFRLIGLQKTNNNALTRAIVLHAMSCIPNEEIDYPICQSEGCPSLSPDFLESISPVIKKSAKPMLLWIFDPTVDPAHMP